MTTPTYKYMHPLSHLPHLSHLTIFDTRPNLSQYVQENLPKFFTHQTSSISIADIRFAATIENAVEGVHIIQESGPENLSFKQTLWTKVEQHAPVDALLWSSTSGIPASQQAAGMQDKTRLLVVHPYNPPHIMPLLELVPSRDTSDEVIKRTQAFWTARGRVPIHIKQETTGFVANRLAFALLREAIHLVKEGVVSVSELDEIHAGGGPAGLEGFFKNIGGTVQDCWNDAGRVNVGDEWEEGVFQQAKQAYGVVDIEERDRITRRLLEVLAEEKSKTSS
ncbi:NAD(P)-binding protein [Cucurbitaria berberidis CBS 394.84]|uniref:NAD(P)-binding protein n=1 Tax=Cucurbitaria berberidis CBS 394.84 TaxID=1168544 RepID=A0A9P4GP07_9PLEO|nr:NAD(P)-binding protein [Cucurbitaria berberidis CBS 394.84]KAF1848500.1 NAD(P)-binding protein [Cucurbitaria berberidis CBS 394.84]